MRAGTVFLGLLVLTALVFYISLPTITQAIAEKAAADAGLPLKAFDVLRVTPAHTVVAPVIIGNDDEQLAVSRMRVRYDFPDVLSGKVDTVLITGLDLTLRKKADSWGIAGLPRTLFQDRRTDQRGGVPWNKILLRDATVRIKRDRGTEKLSVNGWVNSDADGRLSFQARTAYRSYRLRLEGYSKNGNGKVTVNLSEDGQQLAHYRGSMHNLLSPAALQWAGEGKISRYRPVSKIAFGPFRFEAKGTSSRGELSVEKLPVTVDEEIKVKAGVGITFVHERRSRNSGEDDTSVRMELKHPAVTTGGWSAEAENLILTAGMSRDAEEPPDKGTEKKDTPVQIKGRVALHNGNGKTGNVRFSGVEANVPFLYRFSHGNVLAGTLASPEDDRSGAQTEPLQIASISCRALNVKDIRSNITLQSTGAVVEGRGNLSNLDAPVNVNGVFQWSPSMAVTADASFRNGKLKRDGRWYRQLSGVDGLQLTGTVAGECHVELKKSEFSGHGRVKLRNGELSLKDRPVRFSDVETDLEIPDLPALQSAASQQIRFSSAKVSGLHLNDGRLQYRLDGPEQLFVERAQVGFCDGKLETYALALDFPEPDFDVTLYADRIGVGCVLSLFRQFEGTGSGTLYGKVPLSYSNKRISYGDGFLYSQPGEESYLKVQDAGLFTASMGRAAGSRERLKCVEEALKDFHLSQFRIKLNPSDTERETKLRLDIVGRPRDEGKAPPIHLTVNVKGALQQVLNLGFKMQEGL